MDAFVYLTGKIVDERTTLLAARAPGVRKREDSEGARALRVQGKGGPDRLERSRARVMDPRGRSRGHGRCETEAYAGPCYPIATHDYLEVIDTGQSRVKRRLVHPA